MINPSISDVLFTWVPPHNSTEKSPAIVNTLTLSPYLSPKKASAPSLIASSKDFTSIFVSIESSIRMFTRSSTCSICSGVSFWP